MQRLGVAQMAGVVSPARQSGVGLVAVGDVAGAMGTRVKRKGAVVRGEVRGLLMLLMHHATAIRLDSR